MNYCNSSARIGEQLSKKDTGLTAVKLGIADRLEGKKLRFLVSFQFYALVAFIIKASWLFAQRLV